MTQEQTRDQGGGSETIKRQGRLLLLRSMLVLALLFSLTAQFTLASDAPGLSADGPEAAVEITRRDLGEVFIGEELEYAFIVRNTGTKPLELVEKRTASSESTRSGYAPSVAMWRPADRLIVRPVAAVRASPT